MKKYRIDSTIPVEGIHCSQDCHRRRIHIIFGKRWRRDGLPKFQVCGVPSEEIPDLQYDWILTSPNVGQHCVTFPVRLDVKPEDFYY